MITTFIHPTQIMLDEINMDRFLIASNPMSGNNQQAVVHTIDPISIFKVQDGQLTVIFSETSDNEKLEKLKTRAWHWYQSYTKWEK